MALAVVAVSLSASAWAAGPCDGRYQGTLTVQGERGVSVAPLVWTVRDTLIYGGFEGPSGLFLIEGTVDAGCNVVDASARDYVAGEPMPIVGTVTEGMFQHNGPVRVTYRMRRDG
ncbi:MAG: hypothetical protein ACT4N4_08270 [Rhodospirillales bacterium]